MNDVSEDDVSATQSAKQLNVRQVIELLQKLPGDAMVWSDGCDCCGETCGVEYDQKDNSVLMARAK